MKRKQDVESEKENRKSIRETADTFGVTTRALRYYEEEGLIQPRRVNRYRYYGREDFVRIQLIVRGKKLGFPLDEIAEMLQLFDEDPSGRKQLERTVAYGDEKIRELDRQIDELKALRRELLHYRKKFSEQLATITEEEKSDKE